MSNLADPWIHLVLALHTADEYSCRIPKSESEISDDLNVGATSCCCWWLACYCWCRRRMSSTLKRSHSSLQSSRISSRRCRIRTRPRWSLWTSFRTDGRSCAPTLAAARRSRTRRPWRCTTRRIQTTRTQGGGAVPRRRLQLARRGWWRPRRSRPATTRRSHRAAPSARRHLWACTSFDAITGASIRRARNRSAAASAARNSTSRYKARDPVTPSTTDSASVAAAAVHE